MTFGCQRPALWAEGDVLLWERLTVDLTDLAV
jgi:hypothetical protein